MVWLQCLAASDEGIQEGYVELHKYNKDTGKRDRIGDKQVILSPHDSLSLSVTNTFSATIPSPKKSFYAMHQFELE